MQTSYQSLITYLHVVIFKHLLVKETYMIKFRHQWLYQEDRGQNLSGTLWIILHHGSMGSIFLKQTFQINLWKLGPSPIGRSLNVSPQVFPIDCPKCQQFTFVHACRRLKVRNNKKIASQKSHCKIQKHKLCLCRMLTSGLSSCEVTSPRLWNFMCFFSLSCNF